MKRFRDPNWVLIFLFVGILAAVPLVQLVIEATGDDAIHAFELFGARPTSAHLRSYEKTLEQANWAAKVTRPWLQYFQFAALKEGGEKVVVGKPGWYFFRPGLNYMIARPEKNSKVNATNDPVAAIVNFRDQLAAQGIKLLVMPVPNKDSVYPDLLSSRSSKGSTVMAPRTREVLQKLREAKIEVVDLFGEFNAARQMESAGTEARLYLEQDTHWSPLGVDLAAKTVARRLNELGWIEPGQLEYHETNAPVQRLGDIVRMLQVPKIERTIKPENVAARQVIRSDKGQAYKDEASAEILVIGDSFMRIYQEDSPTAAGFIAHLAKELKQPMMSLVDDGGGATLVREELAGRNVFLKKKKVVVWEFVERDIGLAIKGWKRIELPRAK